MVFLGKKETEEKPFYLSCKFKAVCGNYCFEEHCQNYQIEEGILALENIKKKDEEGV